MMKPRTQETRIEHMDKYSRGADWNVTVNYHPCSSTSQCHTHSFYEINYVIRGGMTNEVSGKAIPMREGDAILLHPGVLHIPAAEPQSVVLNILIRPRWFTAAIPSVGEGPLFRFVALAEREEYMDYILFTGGKDIGTTLTHLLTVSRGEGAFAPLAAEGAFLSFLAALAEGATLAPAGARDAGFARFAQILAYLYEHIETVTPAALAARFGYSSAHLSRLFRRYTGSTPSALLLRARLDRAADLLTETDGSVTAVADEAGFSCMPYFHRLFRRMYGLTPAEYRRANTQREK